MSYNTSGKGILRNTTDPRGIKEDPMVVPKVRACAVRFSLSDHTDAVRMHAYLAIYPE